MILRRTDKVNNDERWLEEIFAPPKAAGNKLPRGEDFTVTAARRVEDPRRPRNTHYIVTVRPDEGGRPFDAKITPSQLDTPKGFRIQCIRYGAFVPMFRTLVGKRYQQFAREVLELARLSSQPGGHHI